MEPVTLYKKQAVGTVLVESTEDGYCRVVVEDNMGDKVDITLCIAELMSLLRGDTRRQTTTLYDQTVAAIKTPPLPHNKHVKNKDGLPVKWVERIEAFIEQQQVFRLKDIYRGSTLNSAFYRIPLMEWLKTHPFIKTERINGGMGIGNYYQFTPCRIVDGKHVYATAPAPKSTNFIRTPGAKPVSVFNRPTDNEPDDIISDALKAGAGR